jgi:SMC interacting uncharacterized protein involved in chromosome segregation
MALKKPSPVSSLKSRPAVAGWRLRLPKQPRRSAASLAEEREFQEEMRKVESLLLEMNASILRTEKRLDASLESIDRTLEDLARQKQEILLLERSLGIERKGA